ncbi:MAG: hypothetical protein JW722_03345 [Demequinaceae bacterium]|nr:hypothetical protein [Demequinaceae bacterium]
MDTTWGLIDERSYVDALTKLGIEQKKLDEFLAASTFSIALHGANSAFANEVSPGIYVTKVHFREPARLLRLWYTLDHAEMKAHLVYIDIEDWPKSAEQDEPW